MARHHIQGVSGAVLDVAPDGSLKGMGAVENEPLHSPDTITWDASATTKATEDIDVPTSKEVLVFIQNGADKDLTVTFEHVIDSSDYLYKGADGEALSFVIEAGDNEVFGPIQGWPRYEGGKVVFTSSDGAPADTLETIVQVQEV